MLDLVCKLNLYVISQFKMRENIFFFFFLNIRLYTENII